MLLCIFVSNRIEKAKLGYWLIGVREDEDAAEAVGVDTTRAKLAAFIISGILTSVAGVIYAQYIWYIEPASVLNLNLSIQMALMTIIGGIGTVWGPILGAYFLIPVNEFIRTSLGSGALGLHMAIYGFMLIIVVLLIPKGMVGLGRNAIDRFEKALKKEGELMNTILEVRNVTRMFGALAAVDNVDIHVNQGEILGLIGPNGAGKTTLFNVITGTYKPTHGQVIFNGETISGLKPNKICRKGVARTFQVVKPFGDITITENVVIGALNTTANIDKARQIALECIEKMGLMDKANRRAGSLPIGDRKRLEVARALATKPQLILLDEVMAGLTPVEVNYVLDLIRTINKEGITVIVIEHNMSAVMALSDRIVVLNYGKKLADDEPEKVGNDPEVIKAYLGEDFDCA